MSSPLRLMRNFSIKLRMHSAIVMVLALFGLVGLTALLGGRHLADLNQHFMTHSVQAVHHLGDIRAALGDIRRHEKDLVIQYENAQAVGPLRDRWTASVKDLQAKLNHLLEGEEDADNPVARDALKQVEAYAAATLPVITAIQAGSYDNARAADKQLERAKTHVHAVEAAIGKIEQIIDQESLATQAQYSDAMRQTLWAFVAVLVLVMVVVVPLTLMNSRSIIQPMIHAREVALAIAEGDLTRRVQAEGGDEAAELLRALAHMQGELGRLVGDVRQASGNIQLASNEVASGNSDLSGRTEQAASSLQTTAGSMQQLTQSVQQTAEAADHARGLAGTASQVAERGGAAVGTVVHTMDQINTASRRIGDIIGTIDGIAFQTNILALNAAVEAARAGEQGRGFAVVAGEVRSLAQRSATAAREIKTLINATVAQVDTGTRQVKDAGATMTEIVASVQRVTDIIHEISTAAREQSQGIGMVNGAVGQLDGMTQQNAALVEQSAAAAESLKDQATRLAGVVARFRVTDAA